MTREEAKLILQVCRPGDEADADPQLAAALALAQTDPELGQWFEAEQRWDASLRRELKTVPVPPDLKAQILAGPKIAALPAPDLAEAWLTWRSPMVWGMAAVILIFLGITFHSSRSQPTSNLAAFAHDMIAASPLDAHHVDVENSDFKQVKTWLADRQALADIDLPPAIKNAPGLMGCRIMGWHGRQVSMLCFMMNGTKHVDLFVTPASTVADAPAPGQPRFAEVDQQMTAGWSEGGNVYLMTGKVPEEFLRNCLSACLKIQRTPVFAERPAWKFNQGLAPIKTDLRTEVD